MTPAPEGKPDEIVVFMIVRETKCADCGCDLFKGNLLRMEKERPLCLECADLAHLEYLPRGDTALTRRTTKYSPLRAVVVRWSKARNRYERQGILATPDAIEKAEAECLADEALRARQRERAAERREVEDQQFIAQFAEAIRKEFPGCPTTDAGRIAAHACRKYSGRVGRSAAAKELDPGAVRLAVRAHIRHVHTSYDELLMKGRSRSEAREAVLGKIEEVAAVWQKAGAVVSADC